jgi:hypothetical protein
MKQIWNTQINQQFGDTPFKVSIFGNVEDDSRVFHMEVIVQTPADETTVRAVFQFSDGALQIKPPGTDPFVLCLAVCIGGFAISQITECFINNGHDWEKFKACLEGKAGAFVGRIPECLAACTVGASG